MLGHGLQVQPRDFMHTKMKFKRQDIENNWSLHNKLQLIESNDNQLNYINDHDETYNQSCVEGTRLYVR